MTAVCSSASHGVMLTRRVKYIRDIPLKQRHQICRMLDASHSWMNLAALLDFTNDDVQSFKAALYRPAGSPTDEMLTVWDYGCRTVTELYRKLFEMKHARCMMLLKDFVDPNLHHLIREVQGVQPADDNDTAPGVHPGHPQIPPVEYIPGAVGQLPFPLNTKKPLHDNQPHRPTKPQPTQGSWNDAEQHNRSKAQQAPHRERMEGLTANINKSSEKVTGLVSPFKGWQGERGSSTSVNNKSGNKGELTSGSSGMSSIHEMGDKEKLEYYQNQSALVSLLHIPYNEIVRATGNFNECYKLGEGSFGTVFHAVISMSHYAVKQMKQNEYMGFQMEEIARADQMKELRALVRYRHANIVALCAYCFDGPSPCILYEFMENGSLEDNLLCRAQRGPLDWRIRHKIAEGSALGINFLHKAQEIPLIHGDIKSANILLGKHFEPKIADFGLARLGPENGKTYCYLKTKNAHGTLPYLPEEYKRNSKLSTKVDVYSFGVVLMEILAGERVADSRREPNKLLTDIVEEVFDLEKEPEVVIGKIRDRRCPDWPWDIAWLLLDLARKCTRSKFKLRPEIDETVNILTNIAADIARRDEMQKQREGFPVKDSQRKSPEVYQDPYYEAPTQRYSPPRHEGRMGYPAHSMGPQGHDVASMRRDLSIESNNAMFDPRQQQDQRFDVSFQKQQMYPDQRHYQYTQDPQVYGGHRSGFEPGIRRHLSSETSDDNNLAHDSSLSSLTSYDLSSQMTDPSLCAPLIQYPSQSSGSTSHHHQSHPCDPRQTYPSQYPMGYPGQILQHYPQQTQYQNPLCSLVANVSTQSQSVPQRMDANFYATQLPVVSSSLEGMRHQESIEDHMKQLDISQLATKPLGNPLQQATSATSQAGPQPQQPPLVSSTTRREPEQNTDILPCYHPPGMTERSPQAPLISTISEESDEEGSVLKSSLTTAEMQQFLPRKREPTQQTEKILGDTSRQLSKTSTSASNPDVVTPSTTSAATSTPTSTESTDKGFGHLRSSLTTDQMRKFLPSKREPTEETERLPGEATDNLRKAVSSELPPPSPRAPAQTADTGSPACSEDSKHFLKSSLTTTEMRRFLSSGRQPSQETEKIPGETTEHFEDTPAEASSDLEKTESKSNQVKKTFPQMERGFVVKSDRCYSVPPNMANIQGGGDSSRKTPQQMTEPLNNSN